MRKGADSKPERLRRRVAMNRTNTVQSLPAVELVPVATHLYLDRSHEPDYS
jgi:hypothetical protein